MQQINQSQDTSSQAMTEVALGLSMAFFAILILSLLSMQMPEQTQPKQSTTSPNTKTFSLSEEQADEKGRGEADTQFVFYFDDRFYDMSLSITSPMKLLTEKALVLAVPQSLPLQELMILRQKINHPNLSITVITPEWHTQLEQLP